MKRIVLAFVCTLSIHHSEEWIWAECLSEDGERFGERERVKEMWGC